VLLGARSLTLLRYCLVISFVYLGLTVTNTGNLNPEIDRRRVRASNVMQVLRNPIWRQQGFSRTANLRIHNAYADCLAFTDATPLG